MELRRGAGFAETPVEKQGQCLLLLFIPTGLAKELVLSGFIPIVFAKELVLSDVSRPNRRWFPKA